jgi:predicted CXXCH cytochrome family protein
MNKNRNSHNLFCKRSIVFLVLIGLILLISCTPQKSYKVLSFFFDGVPDPNLKIELIVDSVNTNDNRENLELADREKPPGIYVHAPYEDEKCGDCHNINRIGEFIKPQPELCYLCHTDFNEKFSFLHGPVDGGYCSACHNAHKSKNQYLLINSDQQLCFNCHDNATVNESVFHADVKNTSCTECHNPHGGDKKSLVSGVGCYKCHEDFSKKYNYLHGPVASNYCSTCHSSHDSKSENLLVRKGQQLCLYCHSESLDLKKGTHSEIEDVNCIECHNPHGGEDKYIFN